MPGKIRIFPELHFTFSWQSGQLTLFHATSLYVEPAVEHVAPAAVGVPQHLGVVAPAAWELVLAAAEQEPGAALAPGPETVEAAGTVAVAGAGASLPETDPAVEASDPGTVEAVGLGTVLGGAAGQTAVGAAVPGSVGD